MTDPYLQVWQDPRMRHRRESSVQMSYGRVYLGVPDPTSTRGGCVKTTVVPLPRLEPIPPGRCRLRGRFVCVRNGGAATMQDPATGAVRVVSIGNAQPNAEGDFLFEPGRGGARLD